MTVKSVICAALRIIGRADTADKVEVSGTLEGEEQEVVNTLLCCYNAVEDEIARRFVPLVFKQSQQAENGKYYYSALMEKPLKIRRVSAGGKKVDFKVYADYFETDARKIEVEYEYLPAAKNIGSQSAFGFGIDAYLLAAGAAAEYCLINGEVQAAELWEKRYREGIENICGVKEKPALLQGGVPQRRWV